MAPFNAEAGFGLATALLLAGPTAVLWLAFGRTRGLRPFMAALGFSVFLAADLGIFLVQVLRPAWADVSESVELVADVLTATCFAAAFLLPMRRGDAAAL